MPIPTVVVAVLFGLLASVYASTTSAEAKPADADDGRPINIIYDTDMWGDLDDALALTMLHALQDRGEINLLAVTISSNNRPSAAYADLLNTYYGRPTMPIGMNHYGIDTEDFHKRLPHMTWPFTSYTQRISGKKNSKGAWLYPRRLSADAPVPEALTVLRSTLAAQPDHSVALLQVGYSTNLARLLQSPADEHSSLSGMDLVTRKVRLLVMMGGQFGDSARGKQTPEFNLQTDVKSAQQLVTNWPTPIVVTGLEVGLALPYEPRQIPRDFAYDPNHPVVDSFREFCAEMEVTKLWSCSRTHGSSDVAAALFAARPHKNYFSLSSPGKIEVLDDGSARFIQAEHGRHRYLILNEAQRDRIQDVWMMLASQPPVRGVPPCDQ